ncbi:MAG: hypothetical protein JWN22_1681 [Nocardioides sp.]|jgi:hypothetical protein|nr:hypothetical protein [Nocardioides sp.]
MTEKLKTLLHDRAETVAFGAPDLEAVVRAGDRRLRRRRAGAAAGGLAAVAVVGALLVTQLGGTDPANGPQVVHDPGIPAHVSWVVGSVLHDGDRTVDLGFEATAYVRTTTGIVATSPDGTVHSVVGGRSVDVGTVDAENPHLVADDEGTLAGWVNDSNEGPTFLVLDQSTGEITSNGAAVERGMGGTADSQNPVYFYAIDGRTAYWRDSRGAVAVDVDTDDVRVVDAEARNGFDIVAVENGVIAFNVQHDDARADGTAIGTRRDTAMVLPRVYGTYGAFSPDAHYYSGDADEPQVYDARTGNRVTFDLDYAFATGYEWLDDHTLAMIAQDTPKSSAQLVTCEVPAGTCDVAVDDLGSFDDLAAEGFALPVGSALDD